MQPEYDDKLARCRAGWEATKDPAAVMEALMLAHIYRQPSQLWFVEAACMVMNGRRTKGYITRRRNATIKWMRYAAVRDAAKAGLTWDDAHEDAAEKLARTGACAKSRTMRADYDEVARDLKAGRHALYSFTPKIPKF